MTWAEATRDWPASNFLADLAYGRRSLTLACGTPLTLIWAYRHDAYLIASGAAEVEYAARLDGATRFAGLIDDQAVDEEARSRLVAEIETRVRT